MCVSINKEHTVLLRRDVVIRFINMHMHIYIYAISVQAQCSAVILKLYFVLEVRSRQKSKHVDDASIQHHHQFVVGLCIHRYTSTCTVPCSMIHSVIECSGSRFCIIPGTSTCSWWYVRYLLTRDDMLVLYWTSQY